MNAEIDMAPACDALQFYVDALLEPAAADTDAIEVAPPAPDTTKRERYRVCRIASIRLALPAAAVAAPLPLPSLLAYSSPHGYLGRHRHAGNEWKVIDLAHLAAPGVPHPRPDMLLPLLEQPWALACCTEPDQLELASEDVQWRQGSGARPWLAGMTREGSCAVIDADALIAALHANSRFSDEV